MDEGVYLKYLKMVDWCIDKGSIDYKLYNENREFLCAIKIAHGKNSKREVVAFSIQKTEREFIPKVFQKLVLDCVKAPTVEFPQVGPYLEHRTHLRESQPRGFDAVQDQLLKHFGYKRRGWRWPPQKKLKNT